MPNRILKESICTSETIAVLSAEEEVFFYRLLVNCDDYGRMDGRTAILRAKCFPLAVDRVTDSDIEKWLEVLVGVQLVRVYTVEGKPYLQVVTWDRHQQVRAKKSKYPEPPLSDSARNQMISDDGICPRNPIQSESNPNPNPKDEDDARADQSSDREAVIAYIQRHHPTWDGDWRTRQELGIFAEELGGQGWLLILEALKRTDESRPSNPWKYLQGVLRAWREEGIRTLDQLQIADEQRKARSSSQGGRARGRPAAPPPQYDDLSGYLQNLRQGRTDPQDDGDDALKGPAP